MPAFLMPLDNGKQIILDKTVVFIGRHPDCDVVLSRSKKVSRKHCCIAIVNDSVLVRDLGSLNGIRVNGKPVNKEAPLMEGDELTVGDCRYVLKLSEPAAVAVRGEKAAPVRGEKQAQPPAGKLGKSLPPNVSIDFPLPLVDAGAAEADEDVRMFDDEDAGEAALSADPPSDVKAPRLRPVDSIPAVRVQGPKEKGKGNRGSRKRKDDDEIIPLDEA